MKLNIKKYLFALLLVLIQAFSVSGQAQIFAETPKGNTVNQSFSKAKRILLKRVYSDRHLTFYCEAPFNADKKIVPSNRYRPKKKGKRSERIEWEHIVPAHAFGKSFKAWTEGDFRCVTGKGKKFKGRNCARKVVPEFRYMESDLYNLVPAIGEINGLRRNYKFAIVSGEKRKFGSCDMEIENRKAEPTENIRGNIARIYKYMNHAYPEHGIIGKASVKLFDAWNKADPIDAWECERNKRIERIQGNENPFVKRACIEKHNY